jgi:hypothetical protein
MPAISQAVSDGSARPYRSARDPRCVSSTLYFPLARQKMPVFCTNICGADQTDMWCEPVITSAVRSASGRLSGDVTTGGTPHHVLRHALLSVLCEVPARTVTALVAFEIIAFRMIEFV